VSLSGCFPNLVMLMPRMKMSSAIGHASRGSKPKPMASVPSSSVPTT
jgi:hypothetical protein